MAETITYIDCLVSSCKWKKLYNEQNPKFEQLKQNHDKNLVEMENFAKIVKEGKTKVDPTVQDIIVEKVQLMNSKEMMQKELGKIINQKKAFKIELNETKRLLKDKTNEVFEIKNKYELDEEIVAKKKEVKDMNETIFKLNVERQRLEKIKGKLDNKNDELTSQYNNLTDDYNNYLDKRKDVKKEIKRLEVDTKKAKKQNRLANIFAKKKKKIPVKKPKVKRYQYWWRKKK